MTVERDTEQVFADWIARRQAGEGESLDDLLAAYPERAEEIQDLAERYGDLEGALDLLGMVDTAHAPQRLLDDELRRAAGETLELLGSEHLYARGTELGQGVMARVLRAWDERLEREVAMKVFHAVPGEAPTSHLLRFLREARLTASLPHPGIPPVHHLGVDEEGRPYFTMRLVQGLRLDEVFERARTGEDGWSLPRVLEVMVKVGDTLAFAHARGVVHRDLKPANVMVGEYGEVQVLDWGLARVPAEEEPEEDEERGEHEDPGRPTADSLLDTGHGTVVGTPAYMPPEQAAGERANLGPTADVYALGAMLWELLAGRVPYHDPGTVLTGPAALRRVIDGPPPDLARVAPNAPPELVAICDQAMARDPTDRYADGSALAEDLRAFVEGRVVRAHGGRPWSALLHRVRRNRPTVVALGAAAALVVVLAVLLVIEREQGRAALARLAAPALLDDLERRAERLWPAWPRNEAALSDLLAEVRDVVGRREELRSELERLAGLGREIEVSAAIARVRERSAGALSALEVRAEVLARGDLEALRVDGVPFEHEDPGAELERVRQEMARVSREALPQARLEFEDVVQRARHDLARETVARLDDWATGDRHGSLLADLEHRLEWARSVRRRSIEEPADAWEAARAAVAADPRYGGLELAPQLGLVPLGADPASGLQEFAHLDSGTPARRGSDDALELGPETGIVFVLVPGGEWRPDEDEDAARVRLDPFLLAKHELTRAQWRSWTGDDPGTGSGAPAGGPGDPRRRPVEGVDWYAARRALARRGLALPTRLQWQHAARAGTTTPRWTGPGWERLSEGENLGGAEDGHVRACAVDEPSPNPWGLHHVLGNVSEWCADVDLRSPAWPYRPGSGLRRSPLVDGPRVVCGAHWNEPRPERARWDAHHAAPAGSALGTRGVRPARALR